MPEGATPDAAQLSMIVANNGVGPARVESIEVWRDGQPLRTPGEFIDALRAGSRHSHARLTRRLERHRGRPGARASRRVVTLDADRATGSLVLVRPAAAVESRVCYCSVFDECVLADTRIERGRRQLIDVCTAPGAAFDHRAAVHLLGTLDDAPRNKAGDRPRGARRNALLTVRSVTTFAG